MSRLFLYFRTACTCDGESDCAFSIDNPFFQEEIIECVADDSGDGVRGLVRWHFDLEWAPGGEEFLLDSPPAEAEMAPPASGATTPTALDVSFPWWVRPKETETNVPSAAERRTLVEEREEAEVETMVTPKHRPRDIRLHYYSHIPLDLLAHFEPSEFFPRGWFCRQCGMINTQALFRHQICQSSACKVRYWLSLTALGGMLIGI